MSNSFFSILIPAKGRPNFLVDAIESVLRQDFVNVEILVSNNGADEALRKVAEKYLTDARIRYVEQTEVLDMPRHWEKTSSELHGEYLLVLTDRSVLKIGALSYLYLQITNQPERPEVVSWPWDLYHDHLQILEPYAGAGVGVSELSSEALLVEVGQGSKRYPYSLPRGLNSCVKMELISKMRSKYGKVFRTINPDFSFGYLCLMNTNKLLYIERTMFVSQGLKVSNGGNSFGGDASPYFNTLGIENLFEHLPCKLPLVQSGIHEDYLAMADLCGRWDLIESWSRENYYLECFDEIDTKRGAAILEVESIDLMENTLLDALKKESQLLVQQVNLARTSKKKFQKIFIGMTKKILGKNLESVRKYKLICSGSGRLYKTALEAAGFLEQ